MPDRISDDSANEPIPFAQRLFDNWGLLMGLGLFVMFVVFTAWGLWEILTLPPATLP